MRIAVISDIHGNQVALDAVLQDLQRQAAIDLVVSAGDLCLNGPRPKQVLDTLRALNYPAIQGNVDHEVVTGAADKGAKKRSIVNWTRAQIGQDGIDYLASLPRSHLVHNPDGGTSNGRDALVVHANPLNQEDAIFPTASDEGLEKLLRPLDPTIGALAFGHLHIAYMRQWRNLLLLDVGSCGLPRDEDTRASYGILTWKNNHWEGEIRRVEYDMQEVIAQLQQSDMPNVEKRIKILTKAKY